MFCLRYLALNCETKVKAVHTTPLYAQHPLVLRFRAFCVLISANQLQLRSTLQDLITVDPFFLAPCFISPSEGLRERVKKALEKKSWTSGRKRMGGRKRTGVPLSSDYRRISLAYFRPPSLSLSFSLSPLWSFRRTSLSFPRVTYVSPFFFSA